MRVELNKNLVLYGTTKEIEQSLPYLKNDIAACLGISPTQESEARLMIQELMEQKMVTAEVLINGNSIYNKDKILRNLRSMIRHQNMRLMTNYTYYFLSLACGSIAHYNKEGWISVYPTIGDLRNFFIKNEFGKRVLTHQPRWATDRIKIVREIEKLLKIND
jgi:hypothetical protein